MDSTKSQSRVKILVPRQTALMQSLEGRVTIVGPFPRNPQFWLSRQRAFYPDIASATLRDESTSPFAATLSRVVPLH
jgi:hypothetical protein